MNNQNLLRISIISILLSCTFHDKSYDISIIYDNLKTEISKNNSMLHINIGPIMRGVKEVCYNDNNDTYYISDFSYKDSSKLCVSYAKANLSNYIEDTNIKNKIQNILENMVDLNILDIHNDSISTKISTNYTLSNNSKKLVFVFSKNKSLNIPKYKNIKWLSKTDYVYTTNIYSKLDGIEDFFDPCFIRWLKLM